ncbi:protein rapunzel [Triplophysa dalaica]|uniref:protein rapunzel n=1 Tax=Triplophysa dalaica TaxID=1582913 RepID=UPI0024E00C09|nr:protein rapunzel [Triplophysa dalaica]
MADNDMLEEHEKIRRGLVKVLECVATISSAAAVINPIFGVAGSLIRVVLHHVDDEDIQKFKCEFGSVNRALDEISQQNQNVLLQIRKETVDGLYSRVEENIRTQFNKFMDTVETSQAHQQRQKEFEMCFMINQSDQNLHSLYDGVMGESKVFSQPILEVYMKHSQGDRRVMENLCRRLIYLFCIGFIALMSYAAIVGDDEESLRIEWEEKMKDVAKRMSEVLSSPE